MKVKSAGRPLATCPHTTEICPCGDVLFMMERVKDKKGVKSRTYARIVRTSFQPIKRKQKPALPPGRLDAVRSQPQHGLPYAPQAWSSRGDGTWGLSIGTMTPPSNQGFYSDQLAPSASNTFSNNTSLFPQRFTPSTASATSSNNSLSSSMSWPYNSIGHTMVGPPNTSGTPYDSLYSGSSSLMMDHQQLDFRMQNMNLNIPLQPNQPDAVNSQPLTPYAAYSAGDGTDGLPKSHDPIPQYPADGGDPEPSAPYYTGLDVLSPSICNSGSACERVDCPIHSYNQPNVDGGASIDNGESDEVFFPEYPVLVNPNCTNITGAYLCGPHCRCLGCLAHRAHNA